MCVQIQLYIAVVKILLYFGWCSSAVGISPGFSLLHLTVSLFKNGNTEAILKKELLDEASVVSGMCVVKASCARKPMMLFLVSTSFVAVSITLVSKVACCASLSEMYQSRS